MSIELSQIWNELFTFFVIVAKPAGGLFTPVEANDPIVVLAQMLGEITQAGIVSSLVYPMKKGMSLQIDEEQSATFVHFTSTMKEIEFGKVKEVERIEESLNPNCKV